MTCTRYAATISENIKAEGAAPHEFQLTEIRLGIDKDQIKDDGTPAERGLIWRTERALNLLAAAGLSSFFGNRFEGSANIPASDIQCLNSDWALGEGLPSDAAVPILNREALGGQTIHQICAEVIKDWMGHTGQDGLYLLDTCYGLAFVVRDAGIKNLEQIEPLHLFTPRIDPKPALWIEWATSGWKHYGMVDMTDLACKSWIDHPYALRDVMNGDPMMAGLTDELPEKDADESAQRRAAFDYIDEREARGDFIDYFEAVICPQALIPKIAEEPGGRELIDWLDTWGETPSMAYPKLTSDILEQTRHSLSDEGPKPAVEVQKTVARWINISESGRTLSLRELSDISPAPIEAVLPGKVDRLDREVFEIWPKVMGQTAYMLLLDEGEYPANTPFVLAGNDDLNNALKSIEPDGIIGLMESHDALKSWEEAHCKASSSPSP